MDGPGDATSARHVIEDSLASLRKAREVMDLRIIEVIDGIEASLLSKTYSFTTLADGRHITMVGRHMLLAMFNHQTHHRGQVHCMLTQLGYSIPGLDVPVFTGSPIPQTI
jgi:uncharacterized damage-inducible protein DinB